MSKTVPVVPRLAPREDYEPNAEWRIQARRSIEQQLRHLIDAAERDLDQNLARARTDDELTAAREGYSTQKQSVTRIAEELYAEMLRKEQSKRRGCGVVRETYTTPSVHTAIKSRIQQPPEPAPVTTTVRPPTVLGDHDTSPSPDTPILRRASSEPDGEWCQATRREIERELRYLVDVAEAELSERMARVHTEEERQWASAEYEQQKKSVSRIAEEWFIENLRQERARRGLPNNTEGRHEPAYEPSSPPRYPEVMHSNPETRTGYTGEGQALLTDDSGSATVAPRSAYNSGPPTASSTLQPRSGSSPNPTTQPRGGSTSRASLFAASPPAGPDVSGLPSSGRQRLTLYPRAKPSAWTPRGTDTTTRITASMLPAPAKGRDDTNATKPSSVASKSSTPVISNLAITSEKPRLRLRPQPQQLPRRPASFDPLTHP